MTNRFKWHVGEEHVWAKREMESKKVICGSNWDFNVGGGFERDAKQERGNLKGSS